MFVGAPVSGLVVGGERGRQVQVDQDRPVLCQKYAQWVLCAGSDEGLAHPLQNIYVYAVAKPLAPCDEGKAKFVVLSKRSDRLSCLKKLETQYIVSVCF